MDRYEFLIALTSIAIGGATAMTLIVTIGKAILRRRSVPGEGGGEVAMARLDDRLSRIEQAIDAMSVEVERISEGQRFTTRLLAERSPERLEA